MSKSNRQNLVLSDNEKLYIGNNPSNRGELYNDGSGLITVGIPTSSDLDTVSGTLQTQIDDNTTNITTTSGSLQTQIDGKANTVHVHTESDVTDLDKYTQSEVNTISGTLQTDIDGKAATVHTHIEADITDLDKYTTNEVDSAITTLSGALQSDIDTKADDGHVHTESDITDLQDYITEGEFTVYSGTLQSQIDGKSDTGHDHSGVYQPVGDYATSSELATVSGSLQTQIDAKADTGHTHTESDISDLQDYATASELATTSGSLASDIAGKEDIGVAAGLISTHESGASHDSRYYTESEVDTISGSLQTNIDGKSDTGHNHDADYEALGAVSTHESTYNHTNYDTAYTHSQSAHAPSNADNTSENETSHADVLVDGDIGVTVQAFGDYATASELTTTSGDLQTQIDGKSDTGHNHDGTYEPANANIQSHISSTSNPHSVDETDILPSQTGNAGKVLGTNGSTTSWVTQSGGGSSDHSELSNLDYASAGHTGFQPAGDYATSSELTTTSGDLQTNIDGKSNTDHNHTGTYEPAFSKNTAFNKDFGSASSTVCEGNDSRLSDARTPTSHNNTYHSETYITSTGVTYENLNTNGDVGTGASQVAQGTHTHTTFSGTTVEGSSYVKAPEKLVIPLNQPTSLENGCIWIA